ncbi:MAG: UDP-N-acetylmuramoyl-L-alanyl-D-glutamate--2,6-diaminopimelate ligase [Oscillospiraceae bacterium]|nr:UDP-N-acetylmuramoyl-L-alanyl-D-glutamate--2,6-diaminopimelate ligase [Oscillospiraceae bacterium]
MLLKDLLENVDITELATSLDLEVSGVSYDSRKTKPGDLFVAVKGYESDGHDYICTALEKGAVCVVCEKNPGLSVPFVIVKDSRKALAVVSSEWFGQPAKKLRVIGVTGTNGKTTVTTILKQVIEKCTGDKAGLIGTSGNMIGDRFLQAEYTTPESYEMQELLAEMVKEGCKFAVMEVSSHALFLHRVFGIEFEVGVFTNLSQDHLDFHGTMEAYAQAKAMLFENSKKSAINIDDEFAEIMISHATGTVFTYAVNDDKADLVGKSVKLNSDSVSFCALTIGSLIRVELQIPGMFSVYNALSVVSAAILLGLDIDMVTEALPSCKGVKGRAEVVPIGKDFTVIIDYAHTPDALLKIILAIRGSAKGRVVTLFGCGGDRDNKKRPIMGAVAVEHSDFVIVTSDNPRTENPGDIIDEITFAMKGMESKYRVIENRKQAIFWALENAQPGDMLILAGKGHETYQIIGKEKNHFDEREIVAEFFAQVG